MTAEWSYRLNEAERLCYNLRECNISIPCRKAITMPTTTLQDLQRALNRIREENNKMSLRQKRYENRRVALECEALGLFHNAQLYWWFYQDRNFLSDFEMSNDESPTDESRSNRPTDRTGMHTTAIPVRSTNVRRTPAWLLSEIKDPYRFERGISRKEYYVALRYEWTVRVKQSDSLRGDLIALGAPVSVRHSLHMERTGLDMCDIAVNMIRKENNRILVRRCCYYMLQLCRELAEATDRDLLENEVFNVLRDEKYLSDGHMSDEE